MLPCLISLLRDLVSGFFWILINLLFGAPGLSCGIWNFHWQAGTLDLWLSGVAALGLTCCTACEVLVPQLRIEPTNPALQGRFFTAGSPGRFCLLGFWSNIFRPKSFMTWRHYGSGDRGRVDERVGSEIPPWRSFTEVHASTRTFSG